MYADQEYIYICIYLIKRIFHTLPPTYIILNTGYEV